jgi:hypothetical protein
MSKGGAASTFVTAGADEDMVDSIEGVGSAIGVGFGFWRFGRGELGGEVADIVVVKGMWNGGGGDALTRGFAYAPEWYEIYT